jgi:plastocyanin
MDPDPKAKPVATEEGAERAVAVEVTIRDKAFHPRDVVIRAGESVRWVNRDRVTHTVLSNPGPEGCQPAAAEDFASYPLEPDKTYEYQFTKPGTYPYHCLMHGCSMSGSVTVR